MDAAIPQFHDEHQSANHRRSHPSRFGQHARKIALLFYNALKHGIRYVEQGLEAYEKRYREQSIKRLKKTAAHFGYQLTTQTFA